MPAQLDEYRIAVSTKTAISVKHSGIPRNGSFLRAVGTHDTELLGLARQHLQLPLLSTSNLTMESNSELKTCMQTCLTCGCSDLDPSGDHARFCGGNSFATRLHTVLKWLVASMVKVVAADPSSGVSEVVVEQDGAVRGRLRPGDVAFSVNTLLENQGVRCVVDVDARPRCRG